MAIGGGMRLYVPANLPTAPTSRALFVVQGGPLFLESIELRYEVLASIATTITFRKIKAGTTALANAAASATVIELQAVGIDATQVAGITRALTLLTTTAGVSARQFVDGDVLAVSFGASAATALAGLQITATFRRRAGASV
ncbi:hypothetical protein [Iamia sp.]|uniref:hypothetical protein n=1 Tax=Iamia sp. TaxID=2722710 RepID=UPI002C74C86B|nr:hypothetical protein [Iamia sp.]HXH56605.1 hypothetical protein [Iamia sp.]